MPVIRPIIPNVMRFNCLLFCLAFSISADAQDNPFGSRTVPHENWHSSSNLLVMGLNLEDSHKRQVSISEIKNIESFKSYASDVKGIRHGCRCHNNKSAYPESKYYSHNVVELDGDNFYIKSKFRCSGRSFAEHEYAIFYIHNGTSTFKATVRKVTDFSELDYSYLHSQISKSLFK